MSRRASTTTPARPRGSAARPRRRAPGGSHVVLHIKLPDRPGGLGAVASRIGAVGADITDISVASRSGGVAIDVFHVNLPTANVDLMNLLYTELAEVDGVKIEAWFTATCCS